MKRKFYLMCAMALFVFFGPTGCSKDEDKTADQPDETLEAARPGYRAPVFSLPDTEGNEVSLGDFLGGKVVLLAFWATWCASCKEEIPVLNELHREYADEGLVVLGVNVGESAARAEKFLKKNPAEYAVLLDGKSEVAQAKYHLYGLPANIIIGRDGVVAYREAGLPENPKEFIEKLLED